MKDIHKKILFEYFPLTISFIGILICAIIFRQEVVKTIPVCFSLVIVLINARANRFGFVLGAINSFIYLIGYFMEGLYGTMISALFGAGIQLASFFTWKKRAYKQATEFRKLSGRNRTILIIALLIAWATASTVLYFLNGEEILLDGLNLIIGFVLPVMNLFAFIDALPLHLLNASIHLVMWFRIIVFDGSIANLTYLISAVYGLYMAIRQVITWIKLYKEQKARKKEQQSLDLQ